jgi:hypothetical protein
MKRFGPWAALAGVLFCGLVCGATAQLCAEDGRGSQELEHAACWFGMIAFCTLAAGLAISCLPEFMRFGEAAARFARAERRHLGLGRWRWSMVLSLLILAAGTCAFGYVLWTRQYASSGNYHRDYGMAVAVLCTIAAFAVSIFMPPITAVVAAVGMSSSCRSGAARDLLMGPQVADRLGWAAVRAHALRGWLGLLTFLPLYAMAALLFADAWDSQSDAGEFALFVVTLFVFVAMEMLFMLAAAAVGVWLGAAVPVPALAGALAGPVPVMLWLLRLVVIIICLAIGEEMWSWDSRSMRFWSWMLLGSVAACLGPFCLAAIALRLVRSSLRSPFSVRLGAWMVRHGEGLVGLSGESSDRPRRADEAALEDMQLPRAGPWWKFGTLGVWVLAGAMLILFAVSAALADDRDDIGMLTWRVFWTGYVVLAALGVGAGILTRVIAAQVRRTAAGMARRTLTSGTERKPG